MILSEFLSLFKQGKVSAHSHMKNLLEMAMADGQYEPSEDELLNTLAAKNGISKKKLEEIRGTQDQIEFVVPEDDGVKFQQLYDLVHMMVVDDDVDQEEFRLSILFAKKFGYPAEKAEEIVESLASNISLGNSWQETRKRMEWILN